MNAREPAYPFSRRLAAKEFITLAATGTRARKIKKGTSGIMPKVPGGIAAISILPLPLEA